METATYFLREDFSFFLESTSYVWATAFGRDVGDSKKPLTLSARYLSSWLAFLSLIFVNVYVARLMAEIVKQEPTKPFTSLQDPEVNSGICACVSQIQNENVYLRKLNSLYFY